MRTSSSSFTTTAPLGAMMYLVPLYAICPQVKFLSQEEEQTREECDKKQAAFLAEMARLQESLSSARAALAGAKAEDDEMGQQERQAFER